MSPVTGQAVVEEYVDDDAGIAPPGQGETRQCRRHQRMAVGVGIDAPMQLDRRLDLGGKLPLQAAFDEIAIQAAE